MHYAANRMTAVDSAVDSAPSYAYLILVAGERNAKRHQFNVLCPCDLQHA